MGAARPLLIEHKQAHRSLRKLNLESRGDKAIIIGSSIHADLCIAGAGISPIHAVLDHRGGEWFICDLGSTTGTWISGQSIVEKRINGPCTIQIGPHQLTVRFNKPVRDMFASAASTDANLDVQQIVIKRGTKIVETFLVSKTENFNYFDGAKEHELKAPDSNQWVITKMGANSVYQRLVQEPERIGSQVFEVNGMDVKKPAAMAVGALGLLMIAIAFWPHAPKDELKLNAVQDLNQFQQLIFDSKLVKAKHEEAQKMMAKAVEKVVAAREKRAGGPGTMGGGNGGKMGGGSLEGTKGAGGIATQGSGGQGAKLITSIRASGLNQLIGKIAKRNAKNVIQVGAGGLAVNPDQVASGNALAAIAGLQTAKGARLDQVANIAGVSTSEQKGTGFRLGTVKTNGKGGGGLAYGTGAGLASGGIGKGTGTGDGTGYGGTGGTQGLDDEAEVIGGLDKEVIAEIIKRDIGQIRYCYERQLSSTPELYGKVVVKFTIGTGGEVNSPKVGISTLNNAMVEGCILRRAAKWKFPMPKGGMQVLVSYPFLFKALN